MFSIRSLRDQQVEIPDLLKDALSVSFDTHINHDVLEDADDRFEFYNKEEEKIPFDLEYFNKITKNTPTKQNT